MTLLKKLLPWLCAVMFFMAAGCATNRHDGEDDSLKEARKILRGEETKLLAYSLSHVSPLFLPLEVWAFHKLDFLGSADDIPLIEPYLQHSDPLIRKEARKSISRIYWRTLDNNIVSGLENKTAAGRVGERNARQDMYLEESRRFLRAGEAGESSYPLFYAFPQPLPPEILAFYKISSLGDIDDMLLIEPYLQHSDQQIREVATEYIDFMEKFLTNDDYGTIDKTIRIRKMKMPHNSRRGLGHRGRGHRAAGGTH